MVLCVYIPNTEDAFQHAIVGCMCGMAKPYNQSINQSQWEPQPEKVNYMLCTAWETLVMLTLIHHRHQNYTALDPKQLKQTQRTSRRAAKIPIE